MSTVPAMLCSSLDKVHEQYLSDYCRRLFAFNLDVNELVIVRRVGELVDAILVDFKPFGRFGFGSDKVLKFCGTNIAGYIPVLSDRRPHGFRAHSANCRVYRRSTTVVMPCPNPTHIVATPSVPSFCRMTFSKVPVIRAPEQPNGCPSAMAPP